MIFVFTAPSFSIAFRAMPANIAGFSFTMRLATSIARNGSNFVSVRSRFRSGCVWLKSASPVRIALVSPAFRALSLMVNMLFLYIICALRDSKSSDCFQCAMPRVISPVFISMGIPMNGRLCADMDVIWMSSRCVLSSCGGKSSLILKGNPDNLGWLRVWLVMMGADLRSSKKLFTDF